MGTDDKLTIRRYTGIHINYTPPLTEEEAKWYLRGLTADLLTYDALRWRTQQAREAGVGDVTDVRVNLEDGEREMTFAELESWIRG